MSRIGLGTGVAALNSQVVPISQVVLKYRFICAFLPTCTVLFKDAPIPVLSDLLKMPVTYPA